MPGMPSTDHDLEVAPGEEQDVTKLELFFDLIYVFAVSQLSEHLLDNLTWRGALETLVMSLTVFGVWATTTYESTMVLSRRRTARYLLMGVMVIGLIMNASITRAFEHSPWMFVAPLLAIQIGRPLLTRRVDVLPAMRLHRINMVVWAAVSAVPWVVGALVDEHSRLVWWAAAAAIDLLGMRLRHPVPGLPVPGRDEIDFDLPHQIERCQLFLIICLGEAILTTGNAIIHGLDEPLVVAAGVTSLLVIIGVWALFFGPANEDHVLAPMTSEAHSDDPAANVSLAVLATNGQQVLVLGMVAFAVGAELVVAGPAEPVAPEAVMALFGGIIICVTAFWFFLMRSTDRSMWVSLAVCDAVLICAAAVSVLAGLPGIAVIGLLVVVTVSTAWGFNREARLLAR
jgi:bacterial low temperature requirement A protein (ltrA)